MDKDRNTNIKTIDIKKYLQERDKKRFQNVGRLPFSLCNLSEQISSERMIKSLKDFPIGLHEDILKVSGILVDENSYVYLPKNNIDRINQLNKLEALVKEYKTDRKFRNKTALEFIEYKKNSNAYTYKSVLTKILENFRQSNKQNIGRLSYRWQDLTNEITDPDILENLKNFPIFFHEHILKLSGIKVDKNKDVYLPLDKDKRFKQINKLKLLLTEFRMAEHREGISALEFIQNKESYRESLINRAISLLK